MQNEQVYCTNYSLVPAPPNGFSKYFDEIIEDGRNRPLFAIQAHFGLFGTSLSLNCWMLI